jgi:hypothetical protein
MLSLAKSSLPEDCAAYWISLPPGRFLKTTWTNTAACHLKSLPFFPTTSSSDVTYNSLFFWREGLRCPSARRQPCVGLASATRGLLVLFSFLFCGNMCALYTGDDALHPTQDRW